MSFLKNHNLPIQQGSIFCDYITTIIIDSKVRNKGYTQKMYHEILSKRKGKNISTRTWSTNYAHIHILNSLGFKLIQRDINDRCENIDTLYYLKKPN